MSMRLDRMKDFYCSSYLVIELGLSLVSERLGKAGTAKTSEVIRARKDDSLNPDLQSPH